MTLFKEVNYGYVHNRGVVWSVTSCFGKIEQQRRHGLRNSTGSGANWPEYFEHLRPSNAYLSMVWLSRESCCHYVRSCYFSFFFFHCHADYFVCEICHPSSRICMPDINENVYRDLVHTACANLRRKLRSLS